MKVRVGTLWEALRASYWFVPGLTSIGAIALILLTTWLDRFVAAKDFELPTVLYNGGADGARQLLATLASAMMSVTSVVFSITIVALTLASNQFGPRLLRNFMKDAVSQWTLGIFIATFLYSMLALSHVRDGDTMFVPQISVTCAQALAVLSTGVLIYFIHHISTLIQADQVVRAVHDEVCDAIERLLPETDGTEVCEDRPVGFDGDASMPLPVAACGYIEGIDYDEIVGIAKERGLVVRFRHRPGDFVPKGARVADVLSAAGLDEKTMARLRGTIFFGPVRTPTQDVEFGMLQLAEIAVRSLSPGVNDPFTAVACVDRLGSALRELCDRPYPPALRLDDDGTLRVILRTTDFEGHVNAAFNQIRQNARGSVAVHIRMLEAFATIAEATSRADRLEVLRIHAGMVLNACRRDVPEKRDLADVEQAWQAFTDLLSSRIS